MKKSYKATFVPGIAACAASLVLFLLMAAVPSELRAQTPRNPAMVTAPDPATMPSPPWQGNGNGNMNNGIQTGQGPFQGQQFPQKPTPEMKEFPGASDQWLRWNAKDWVAEEKERHEIKPMADNKPLLAADSQKEGDTYGNYTEADLVLWQKETERLVVMGSLIFHNASLLGSTNGTSCDMCHPDAEGTHAETYPKYQVQLGRAALLRDMANWCLENPCRAEPMSGDDFRMRALEAYMQAQRTGKPMKYGKH